MRNGKQNWHRHANRIYSSRTLRSQDPNAFKIDQNVRLFTLWYDICATILSIYILPHLCPFGQQNWHSLTISGFPMPSQSQHVRLFTLWLCIIVHIYIAPLVSLRKRLHVVGHNHKIMIYLFIHHMYMTWNAHIHLFIWIKLEINWLNHTF